MLEILLMIILAGGMAKIADSEGQSGIIWGGVTVLAEILTLMFVPLPFLRVLGAAVITFVGYVIYKVVAKK